MNAFAKTIALAHPPGCSLLVTRNNDAPKLTLSICIGHGRSGVQASVALDARGWNELASVIACPPALPPLGDPILLVAKKGGGQ